MLTCDSTTRVEIQSLEIGGACACSLLGTFLTQQALSTPGHIHNTYILYRYTFFFVGFFFSFIRRSADFWITSKIYVVSASLILFFAVSPDLSITVLCTISDGFTIYHYCSTLLAVGFHPILSDVDLFWSNFTWTC